MQYAFLARGRDARLFNAIWIPLMLAFFGSTSLSSGHQWWRWLLLVMVALSAVQAIIQFLRMRGLERKLGLTKAHFA